MPTVTHIRVLLVFVAAQKFCASVKIVVGKIDRHLLGILNIRSNLYGKIRIVFVRPALMRHLIQGLRDFGGVLLADAKHNRFPDFTADRVGQSILDIV